MGDDEVPRRLARARRVESLTIEPNGPRPSATPVAVGMFRIYCCIGSVAAAFASGISFVPLANDYYSGGPGHWEFIGALSFERFANRLHAVHDPAFGS